MLLAKRTRLLLFIFRLSRFHYRSNESGTKAAIFPFDTVTSATISVGTMYDHPLAQSSREKIAARRAPIFSLVCIYNGESLVYVGMGNFAAGGYCRAKSGPTPQVDSSSLRLNPAPESFQTRSWPMFSPLKSLRELEIREYKKCLWESGVMVVFVLLL